MIKKILLMTCALLIPVSMIAQTPKDAHGKLVSSLAPMLTTVTPAIVNITAENIQLPNQNISQANKKPSGAVGSGVIVNAQHGIIITNAHVINQRQLIIVTLKDGRRFHAKVIGMDRGFDIALIRITATHLHAIQFANSDKLEVGDSVAAIGSPYGLSQSVTSGVISALNRNQPRIEGYQSFIQTDASINPGNSGGALVDLDGRLIGINTAIITPSYGNIGIGFAIPSNMVASIAHQLLKYGKVQRGMLGVVSQNISPALASALHLKSNQGVIVTQVVPGSPANTSGIKVRDVILKVNNDTVRDAIQLHNMLGLTRPGSAITLQLQRNKQLFTIHAIVGNPKKIQKKKAIPFLDGLMLQNFDQLNSNGTETKGVIVANVNPESQAFIAGIARGDVIVSANDENIDNLKNLEHAANKASTRLLLNIKRGNENLFLVITKN